MKDPGNDLQIVMFTHCDLCLKEKPEGISLQKFALHDVGFTKKGLQVWCVRHNCNILNIDFEGKKLPANITRKNENTLIRPPNSKAALPS